ncbi:hypothetical protein PGTUg99_050226 [Puccinia graminis f. sp. tritici]|uniref:No apical meristem-associated C-terminal domain-containing protein n=1 Tax=Puccinia graminis f. sp. tritici TaxID=56615 RepID=A0A5B0QS01_PUCGR|nr:hypothetical protein PGTUg99_050226 [Puccinia graminis f. sp. tritici]
MLNPMLQQLATPPAQESSTLPVDPLQIQSKRPRASPIEETNRKNDKKQKKEDNAPKNPHWRIEEDKHLCISWLNTSKDADIGTGQKLSAFWEQIHEYFIKLNDSYTKTHKNDKNFKPLPNRAVGALECRWATVLHRVNKYCAAYGQVERRLGSGKTRDEIAVEAKELFKADQGINFTLDHCWAILHNSPKWQETMDEIEAKPKKDKKKLQLPTSEASSVKTTTDDESLDVECLGSDRPEGRKAAKKRKYEENEALEGQKELIKISQQKMELMQTVADEAIMGRDLSNLDDISLAYYAAKKKDIAKRNGLL